MRTVVFGLILALTLAITSPVVAAEEKLFEWPSFDVTAWFLKLFEVLSVEAEGTEPQASASPDQEDIPPASEMGPIADPIGEPTEEMGPAIEPIG